MDKKLTSIIGYVSLLGWFIAFFAGDREGAKFYLNQSLVIGIFSLVFSILRSVTSGTIFGVIFAILVFVSIIFDIIGLVHAWKQDDKSLPLIGKIQILK